MNVLLVQPPVSGITFKGRIVEPLALEILAATIQNKHNVKILDMRIENTFRECIDEFKPDCICYTCYICQVDFVRDLAKKAKKKNPNVINIVGGEQPTHVPEDFNLPEIDYMSLGDGEHAFPMLIDCIVNNGDITQVIGGVKVDNGNLIFGQEREVISSLDDSPIPARELTRKYRSCYKFLGWKNVASIATSRGCKNRCDFCSIWKIRRGITAQCSVDRVIQELKLVEEKNIYLCEAHSFQDIKFMENLHDEIVKNKIEKNYMAYVRVNVVVNHPEMFEKWYKIGLKRVFIGFESIDDDNLKKMKKATNSSWNEQAISILHNIGIEIVASFIINLDFKKRDFDILADWVIKHQLTMPVFNILTPLPGHELYHDNKKFLDQYPYSYFDFNHALLKTELPKAEFYSLIADLYRKTYSNEISAELRAKLGYDDIGMENRRKVGNVLAMNMEMIMKLDK